MQCVFASLDLGLAATKLKLTAPITQSHTTLNHRLVHQASEVPSATRLVKHLGCNASRRVLDWVIVGLGLRFEDWFVGGGVLGAGGVEGPMITSHHCKLLARREAVGTPNIDL